VAKLYFRYGAMNCGKTTLLLQAAHNYEERGMKVIVMKPSVDTKGGNSIVSRLGAERQVDHLIGKDENIMEYAKELEDIKCIFVDEAQFLSSEQVDQLMEIVVYKDIPVICYGLRTDFQAKGFPGSPRLLSIAHTIEELKTVCKCGKKAMYNARKKNGEFIFEGGQVAIDGEDEVAYESLCAKCYLEERDKAKTKVLKK